MDYLLEITKIIDGGIRSDRAKVAAYAEQLARKLLEAGEASASARIRACLLRQHDTEVSPNDFAPATPLPVDLESRLHLADEIEPSRDAPFIALPHDTQVQIDQFIRYVTRADELLARGVGISPSLLVYGPPGCGKTVLASHIASRLGLPLLIARSDSLISSFLGSTAKNLRALFEHAMSRPSVLFLDEFDAFAKVRDDQHELGELKRVVVSLLQNIDALDGRTILLAASNHEHLLDPAVWRRFAYKICLGLPEGAERLSMFKQFLGAYSPDSSLELFARISDTLSGSSIRHVCNDAIRDSVLEGASEVNESQILLNLARLRASGAVAHATPEHVQKLHDLDPEVFNGKRLAQICARSPGTISRWLRK